MKTTRTERAIKDGYKKARELCIEARQSLKYNDRIGYRAALEGIAEIRTNQAVRHLSVRLGRKVSAQECAALRHAA